MKKYFIVIILIACTLQSMAQVKVESNLSAVEMLVGQQVQITVAATADKDANVVFPQEATFPMGVEFMGAIDMPD